MDWSHIYQEAKSWQTAIGSVLGFLALMIGALWNFHLNRKRDAALRCEEIHSVAAALYGEILLLRKESARVSLSTAGVFVAVGTQRNPMMKFDDHFLEAQALPEPILYKALASRLGLLPADMVIAITRFHSNVQSVKSSLPLLLPKKDRGYTHSVLNVLVPARGAVRDIVSTLRQIEAMLSITPPAGDPDMGDTDTVIDMEEATFAETE
jgi:hypothetical protein